MCIVKSPRTGNGAKKGMLRKHCKVNAQNALCLSGVFGASTAKFNTCCPTVDHVCASLLCNLVNIQTHATTTPQIGVLG